MNKKLGFVALAMTLVVSLAGCASGEAEVQERGADWTGATVLPSATIGVLNTVRSAEVAAHWEDTTVKAVEALGWTANTVDGKGDPSVWGQAMSSFVQQRVDGIIVIGGIQTATIATQLRAARDAGIPLVHTGITAEDPGGFFDGDFAPNDANFGVEMGNYLNGVLPPSSEFVTLTLTAIPPSNAPVPAATEVLEEAGHRSAGSVDLNLSQDLPPQVTKGATDLLRAHPDAKAILSCCDFSAAYSVPALEESNHPDVLNVVRYDNLSVLDLIRKGKPVVTVAANTDEFVLTAVDQLASAIATDSEIDASSVADMAEYTVIDSTNVPESGYFYDPDAQLSTFLSQWKAEYK